MDVEGFSVGRCTLLRAARLCWLSTEGAHDAEETACARRVRVAFVMEADDGAAPVDDGFLGAIGIVEAA
jgi:hypothetical protein